MHLSTTAIICTLRAHGENGVIVRALTAEAGLMAGYVRGGRSRRLRPTLMPGNVVAAEYRSRTADQLASLTVELVHSRAPLMTQPLAASALDWVTLLTGSSLPEGQAYPAIHTALGAVIEAVAMAPSARGWAAALAQYELLVLRALGFGLALETCVVTGASEELMFVSPKSAAAVSRSGAVGYEARLLPLPAFLRDGGTPDMADALDALKLSGYFVEHRLFDHGRGEALAVRQRMIDRLQRTIA